MSIKRIKKLTVTIMAAGEGKRMNSSIPKVLCLFKGIPMLIRIILEVTKLNPNKIIIITGKYDVLIRETISNYDNVTNPININIIEYVQQKNPQGTADAIKCTLNNYVDNENVLILNGDMPLISERLLSDFVNYMHSGNKIMVARLDNPYGYGRIIYDNNLLEKTFIGIKEEKDCTEEEKMINIVNVGIYFFHSSYLKKYIPLIDNNNQQKEYYLTDIIKIIKNQSQYEIINTYCVNEHLKYQIMGVNTQEELHNLENNSP